MSLLLMIFIYLVVNWVHNKNDSVVAYVDAGVLDVQSMNGMLTGVAVFVFVWSPDA